MELMTRGGLGEGVRSLLHAHAFLRLASWAVTMCNCGNVYFIYLLDSHSLDLRVL